MPVTFYTYDGEGHRVMTKRGIDAPITYVYDAFGGLTAEYGGTSTLGGTSYLLADHLGSTRAVTDSNGTIQRKMDYWPFGAEISGIDTSYRTTAMGYIGDTEPRQKFTGKERDADTGQDYFGARYYSGAQGRFTSPDPLIEG